VVPDPASSSGVRIREYEAADRAFVLSLVPQLLAAGSPPWRDAGQMVETDRFVIGQALDGVATGSVVLIAVAGDGRRLGFTHLCPEADYYSRAACGHIADIVVAPDQRGRGVGQALIAAAQEWARDRGYRLLSLNVLLENMPARQLYERLGFSPETIRYVKVLKEA